MYNNHVGQNIDDYDKREGSKYNFIFILKDPKTQIWQNLDKRLK